MTPEMFAEWWKPCGQDGLARDDVCLMICGPDYDCHYKPKPPNGPAFIPWLKSWTPSSHGKHDPHSSVRYAMDIPPDYKWIDATDHTVAGWVAPSGIRIVGRGR